MPIIKRSRTEIDGYFQTSDIPTQQEYQDTHYSLVHYEDVVIERHKGVTVNFITMVETLPDKTQGAQYVENAMTVEVGKGIMNPLEYDENMGYEVDNANNRIYFKAAVGMGYRNLENLNVRVTIRKYKLNI